MNSEWRNELTSMKKRNGYLLKSGLRSDCSFMVGAYSEDQRFFQAHKFVLANASPVFERMFYGSFPTKENQVIEILDIDPDDFKSLLRFIYIEEVEILNVERAQRLYYAASKYMLDQLMPKCIQYLTYGITTDNVCQIFEFAKQFEERSLEEKCETIIRTKTSDVLLSSTFLLANLETLDFILSQDKLQISHESQLFKALQRYAEFRFSINKRPDSICSVCKNQTSTIELTANKSETVSDPVGNENNVNDDSKEKIVATKQNENKEKELSREAIEDIAHFSKLIKKIRFLTYNSKDFAAGPALSKLLSNDDALALLICITEPKNFPNNFPYGFSDSKLQRFSDSKEKLLYSVLDRGSQ